jgi:hypothetical protein
VRDHAMGAHPLCADLATKVFVMLRAYMDDSGTHDGSHNCLIAGYWGSLREWARLEKQWKSVLQSEGIEEFKSNEFWPRFPPEGKRIGPYKTWTDARHRGFIDRLLKIIEDTRVYPFASGFVRTEWDNLDPFLKRVFAGLEDDAKDSDIKSVVFPFTWCVGRIADYCKSDTLMHFVLDDDPRIAKFAAQVYTTLKRETIRDKGVLACVLGDLTFADSRIAVPLQAADLLAYEAHRYAKKAQGDANALMRDEYRRALAHFRTRDDFHLFDGVRLQNLQRTLAKMVEAGRTPTEQAQ